MAEKILELEEQIKKINEEYLLLIKMEKERAIEKIDKLEGLDEDSFLERRKIFENHYGEMVRLAKKGKNKKIKIKVKIFFLNFLKFVN